MWGRTIPASMPDDACCEGQSWCAVTCTTEVLARKWHTVIVARLLERGPMRFSDLEDTIEDISGKVLSESLDDLVDQGILARNTLQETPRRVAYSLTEAGADLRPVIEAMEAWGNEHLNPSQTPMGAGDGLLDP
jgi:DNA-binding HxlR family transcriptional regulator